MTKSHDQPPTWVSRRPSVWDVVYALNMGAACMIAYWITSSMLPSSITREDDLLGGMWAAVATAFVFRDTSAQSLSAGAARLIATSVSFALCLLYLTLLPPHPISILVLVALGTLIMMLLNRRGDIVTTAITTIVVMVVAIIAPAHARLEPLLRLLDTGIGIGIGVSCRWMADAAYAKRARAKGRGYV